MCLLVDASAALNARSERGNIRWAYKARETKAKRQKHSKASDKPLSESRVL
jgi:hypothetical protein